MSNASRRIARLPLEIFRDLNEMNEAEALRAAISSKLQAQRLHRVEDLFFLDDLSLLKTLDPLLCYEECLLFMKRVASACAPKPKNAKLLLNQVSLPTGIGALDKQLRGGVRFGSLTELVGSPGTGKTQLCMQLCLMATSSGFGCIYMDTENKISLERMVAMLKARSVDASTNYQHVLDNISVRQPNTIQELVKAFEALDQDILLSRHNSSYREQTSQCDVDSQSSLTMPVRLVILDSIAAPMRRDDSSVVEKSAILIRCARRLKQLADQLNLCIIVVNQVGAPHLNDPNQGPRAALGTSWHHCVSTRLQFGAGPTPGDVENLSTNRTVMISKSNMVPTTEENPVSFCITTTGLKSQ